MAVFQPLEPDNKQERTNGIKSIKKYYASGCCRFSYRNHPQHHTGFWVNRFWGFQVAHARYHDYAPVFAYVLVDFFPPFTGIEDGALF